METKKLPRIPGPIKKGDTIYPIFHEHATRHESHYTYGLRPGKTNLSHEERIKGWLGCSYDWHRTAIGEYVVTRVTQDYVYCQNKDEVIPKPPAMTNRTVAAMVKKRDWAGIAASAWDSTGGHHGLPTLNPEQRAYIAAEAAKDGYKFD